MKCTVTKALDGATNNITRQELQRLANDVSLPVRDAWASIKDNLGIKVSRDGLFDHRAGRCDCERVAPLTTVPDSIEALIARNEAENPIRPGRFQAPRGWEPGITRFQADGVTPAEITTSAVPMAAGETDWLDRVKDMGIVLPEGYTVRLLQANYDGAAWTRSEEGADAVTQAVWRYKFAVVPLPSAELAEADTELLDLIRGQAPTAVQPLRGAEGRAFVVSYADLQIGKRDDAGGSEETRQRITSKTQAALARLDELIAIGRPIDSIYITLLGDCLEGFTSQNGRLAFRQDLAPTQQQRVFRRLLTWIIKEFAKYGLRTVVATIPGNHDEVQRNIATYHDDDLATETATAVEEILAENPDAYGHVSFVFPQHDRSTITLDIAGTIVGLAHGHQMRGGAEKWWMAQAHGCQPIGEATLLLTGHYHHLVVKQSGRKTWMQMPALDNGSRWFTETSGHESPTGLHTMLVGGGTWDDVKLL